MHNAVSVARVANTARITESFQMTPLDNSELFELYENADYEKSEEVKEIEKAVEHVVEEIEKFVAKEDPLFKGHILCSGSIYEDLKVEQPDEFDYMFCLEDLSKPGVCRITDIPKRVVKDPGYILVRIEDAEVSQRWSSYISQKQNLKSKTMLERFKDLVSKALEKITLPPKITYHGSVELRKIPVTFKLTWNGQAYRDLEIAVDLPLCIYFEGWPEASQIYCPRSHPGYGYLKKAKSRGYHLVASCIGESGVPRPCWRLSFSIPEGIILRKIIGNSELVHRAVIMSLKVLRKKHKDKLAFRVLDDPIAMRSSFVISWVFHSYVIKTMFLQEWLDYPGERYWRKDKLAVRVHAILERMKASIERKDIRSFWVSDYKLFNFKARPNEQTQDCSRELSVMMASIKIR